MGIGAITLFVENVSRAKEFYARVFELPLIFEDGVSAVFQFENTIVNLLKSTEANELIAPAKVSTQPGARFQLTIWVNDADASVADLEAKGVSLINGPLDRAWGQRTACFADPDGHLWEIAQHLD
jgi:catechol 2,3-dioxygenase-like lactoylglutathione lyase family enzyme